MKKKKLDNPSYPFLFDRYNIHCFQIIKRWLARKFYKHVLVMEIAEMIAINPTLDDPKTKIHQILTFCYHNEYKLYFDIIRINQEPIIIKSKIFGNPKLGDRTISKVYGIYFKNIENLMEIKLLFD